MKKIYILSAILLTLCITGCIFRMEDFSEPYGYVFFFKNDSSQDLYVEIVDKITKESSERQLNIGEELFFLGNTYQAAPNDIGAIYLYSDSTKSNLIYYESILAYDQTEIRIIYHWEKTQLDLGLAKEYFKDTKDIKELYKMTFTFTDEFLEEVRE